MANERNLITVQVDRNTGQVVLTVDRNTLITFDDFDNLVKSEGTQALQDNWSSLRSKLREYLQIVGPERIPPTGHRPPRP